MASSALSPSAVRGPSAEYLARQLAADAAMLSPAEMERLAELWMRAGGAAGPQALTAVCQQFAAEDHDGRWAQRVAPVEAVRFTHGAGVAPAVLSACRDAVCAYAVARTYAAELPETVWRALAGSWQTLQTGL